MYTKTTRPKRISIIAAVLSIHLLLGFSTFAESSPQKIWDISALQQTPQIYETDEVTADGVRAVFFQGLPWQGKPTRVFAWIGTPEHKPNQKLPAIVLVHGGGGTAFAEWVRLWTKRGYAAIAMDTCGSIPKGSYGKWQRHEHGGPAGWGGFDQIDQPIGDQWTFHAVADVILAHSLLRSLPEVDPDKIGITGISWGGYLTCITAGVDSRFKFAVPVYGCGFLGDNSAWLKTFENMPPEKSAKWLRFWDPSSHLPNSKMPMLWVTGTNDFAYPMDSLQKSYRLPTGPKELAVRIRMPHGHGGAGENPEEIHIFADRIVNKGKPLATFSDQGTTDSTAWAKFTSQNPVQNAQLNFTKDTGQWQKRLWQKTEASIDSNTNTIKATLPVDTKVYYFNLIDKAGIIASSEHIEIQ
jgi:cephalosporin-C deacetylase-like acetyl esterase